MYGIYYDDTEYDYLQHLKPIGEDSEALFIEAPAKNNNKKDHRKDFIKDFIKENEDDETEEKIVIGGDDDDKSVNKIKQVSMSFTIFTSYIFKSFQC